MASDAWVSWRVGRNFRAWHARDGVSTVVCGVLIPDKAAKCFAADDFVATLPEAEVCKKCKRLRMLKPMRLTEFFK